MREETVTAVRYNPTLGRDVVVRLTYNVSEGPRPDIVRWFLVREEVLKVQDGQTLNCGDDAVARQTDIGRYTVAASEFPLTVPGDTAKA
jgi:hypothetical protein